MSEKEKEAAAQKAAAAAEAKKAAANEAKKNNLVGQLGRLRVKRTRGISG